MNIIKKLKLQLFLLETNKLLKDNFKTKDITKTSVWNWLNHRNKGLFELLKIPKPNKWHSKGAHILYICTKCRETDHFNGLPQLWSKNQYNYYLQPSCCLKLNLRGHLDSVYTILWIKTINTVIPKASLVTIIYLIQLKWPFCYQGSLFTEENHHPFRKKINQKLKKTSYK